MRKLEHLIYTELRSGIGMNIEGKRPGSTGYGVYSMSEGLLPGGSFRNRALLELSINLKNFTSLRDRLFLHSYAYFTPADGMPMLGSCFQRDGSEDTTNRLAMAYVDEWYFGELNCYPMELLPTNLWNAHKKPYHWYSQDAPNPTPFLATVDLDTVKPVSLRDEALRFARAGREDPIRKAVWMLLKQMSLPSRERKYLVIRDTEENVRLWIAAILYQLPLQAALKVGFNTNLADPKHNVYYFNTASRTIVKQATPGVALETLEPQYHAMIVGIHPKDNGFDSNKSLQIKDQYVLIDGVNKTCFPVDEADLNREYFRCMFTQDQDILNFFMDMNELVDVEPDLKLLDLFDAQRTLQAKGSWTYPALVRSLVTMAPHFSNHGRSILLKYVLKHLCCPEGYAARFATEDATKRLALMRMLRKGAAIVGNNAAIAELDRAAQQELKKLLSNPLSGGLEQYCADLDALENGLSSRLMQDLLRSGLQFLEKVNLEAAPDSYVERLYKLLDSFILTEGLSWTELWANKLYENALDRLAQRVSSSDALTRTVAGLFKNSSQAMDRLLIAGARRSGSSRWLSRMIAGPITLDYLFSIMSRNHMDPQLMEAILCDTMMERGMFPDIQNAYNRYLSQDPTTGQKYYETWMKQLSGAKTTPQQYASKVNDLLESAHARPADKKYLMAILQQLDATVTFELTDYNRKIVDLLFNWHAKCRFVANNAELWSFLDTILENTLKNRQMNMYERYICKNPDCDKFTAPRLFVRTPMGERFLETALKNGDIPAVHAVVLLMLDFTDKADQTEYLDDWAARVCDITIKSKGKNAALPALYALYDYYCTNEVKLSRECDQIIFKSSIKERKLVLESAIRSVRRYLSEINTEKVFKDIIGITWSNYGQSAGKGLGKLFEDAQEAYSQTHQTFLGNVKNTFSKWFGHNQDKE